MSLEDDLKKEFEETTRIALQYGFPYPTWLMGMIDRYGAVDTVKRLLAKRSAQKGFEELQKLGLLHLTVEASVVKKKYANLFTAAEITEARRRLEAYGYTGFDK